jgi:hypothetical protein
MLRIVSISLLIFLYTLSTCRVFVPFLHYAANKEYYLERCENKDKPELECDGCCQIVKEVQQETQREQSPQSTPTNERESTFQLFHIVSDSQDLLAVRISSQTIFFALSPQSLAEGYISPLFQPPRIA